MAEQVLDYQLTMGADGFVGGAGAAAVSLESFTKSSGGAAKGLNALNKAMNLVGFQAAPAIAGPLSAVTGVLQGIRMSAQAAGVSITAMTGTLAVVTASMFAVGRAVSEWQQLRAAEANEEKTENNLRAQNLRRARSLSAALDTGANEGIIPSDTAAFIRQQLNAPGTKGPQEFAKVLDELGVQLGKLGLTITAPGTIKALERYTALMQTTTATIKGPAASQAEGIRQKYGELLQSGLDLALKSNQPFEPLRAALLQARDTELAGIGGGAALKPTTLRAAPVTELERIGFVFNRGGFAATDFNRETAQNTKLANTYLKQIAEKTTDNNFANQ